MQNYLDLLKLIKSTGTFKADRTGTGTYSIFGSQLRFDLQQGFPIITTKKIHFKSIVHELLWFLKGSTNIRYLTENGVTIWNEWADEDGNLGPVYGKQWRAWQDARGNTIDQIKQVINEIKINPDSRRLIVSAWNVGELAQMALPPCHLLFQFYVADNKLSCHLYQRSADIFLGLPFNISSYALLTALISHVTHLRPGELIISLGDAHIYSNHLEQVELQLSRNPFALPHLKLNPEINMIDDFSFADIHLLGYTSHPTISAPIAV